MTTINTPTDGDGNLKTRLEGLSLEEKARLLEMLKQDKELVQSNEKKENEDLDVFRKDLIEHFYEYDQYLSSKVKELGDKLIESGDFRFEDTEYGKVGVLKINGNEYRFLSMDKIGEDLMIKYNIDKDIISKGNTLILGNRGWSPDVIENKYMPGGSEENKGVKKMIDDISHDLGLSTVNQNFMGEFGDGVMKALGMGENSSKHKNFNTAEKGLYLYAYLMGPTSLGRSFLNDYPTYEGNVKELRGTFVFTISKNSSTYENEVSPFICALGEDGGKLFFASKKSTK